MVGQTKIEYQKLAAENKIFFLKNQKTPKSKKSKLNKAKKKEKILRKKRRKKKIRDKKII